jgi:DNA invertase Pin-like site-specific DNA recombinase
MMANVLASIAQFETEVRGERIAAGLEAARKAGKKLGGRKRGTRIRLTVEKEMAIRTLRDAGVSITDIAKTLSLSRPTVYKVLNAPH